LKQSAKYFPYAATNFSFCVRYPDSCSRDHLDYSEVSFIFAITAKLELFCFDLAIETHFEPAQIFPTMAQHRFQNHSLLVVK
jgi:hypothetical protein